MKRKLFSIISSLLVLSACGGVANSSTNSNVSSSSSSSITSIHSSSSSSSNSIGSSSSSTNKNSSSTSAETSTLEQLTIAEFLAKKDTVNFYILSGIVNKITNTQYGNFILEDETGSIFVWGLYTDENSTDKYGFSSLGIKEGDKVTIAGVYYYYEQDKKDEVKNAYFISKESTGTGSGSTEQYIYTDFTAAEKQLFTSIVGEIPPFIPNNEYYVEDYVYNYEDGTCEEGLNFYTFGNSEEDFQKYLLLFSKYEYDGTDKDEYGDDWYYYSSDNCYIDLSYYYYEETYVLDLYIYTLEENSSGSETPDQYIYTDFTAAEKQLFTSIVGEIPPFIPNNEYYVEDYVYNYEDGTCEEGVNFYTLGNSKEDFQDYLTLFSKYGYDGTDKDEYGDDWYYYSSDNCYIDLSYYYYEGAYIMDLYIYILGEGEASNVDLLTNAGKGLPTSSSGVYNVDFSKGKYVKNVTEQGYYLDGCPTTGSPAVLVVPVEFSDVTALSKNYDIDKIVAAFKGNGEDCDYYSLHDYYYISSYQQLDLDITVLDYWFMPEHDSSYYATATRDTINGEEEVGDQLIIDEILTSLEGKLDLTKFDSDNNGFIDSIVLINTLDINDELLFNWAYRYWNLLTDDEGYYYDYDGVSANDYLWASYQFMFESYDEEGYVNYDNKNLTNTYTYIHEFGHILGADDYYDTAYIGTPLDGCDIMDSMLGDHNAFTKFNYGWLTNSRLVVAEESVTLDLEDFSKNGDTIIIANNFDEELGAYQEYYIVVYYTNNGLNSGDYGYFSRNGIVVYHVNASLYKEVYDGITYYDIYNNNTDVSNQYGTKDNLIEFVKSPNDTFTYMEGDSLSSSIVDDQGNTISYTFVVDSLTETTATLTFTKN